MTVKLTGKLICVILDAMIVIEVGISLETLLTKVGLQKPLDHHFREDFFKKHLDRGARDRITGIGLKKL
jgi:hypothetical protein